MTNFKIVLDKIEVVTNKYPDLNEVFVIFLTDGEDNKNSREVLD
jgi:hypothetical protein